MYCISLYSCMFDCCGYSRIVLDMWCIWYSVVFFFFKQKTAYEMRISDWSSDVCSSDLRGFGFVIPQADIGIADASFGGDGGCLDRENARARLRKLAEEIGRASCRERVCQYV